MTTWNDATTINSGLVDLGAAIPKAKYGVWWKNYMFVCEDLFYEI